MFRGTLRISIEKKCRFDRISAKQGTAGCLCAAGCRWKLQPTCFEGQVAQGKCIRGRWVAYVLELKGHLGHLQPSKTKNYTPSLKPVLVWPLLFAKNCCWENGLIQHVQFVSCFFKFFDLGEARGGRLFEKCIEHCEHNNHFEVPFELVAENCCVLLTIAEYCLSLLSIAYHCWALLIIAYYCLLLLSIAEHC